MTTSDGPALTKVEMIEWGNQLWKEAWEVDRVQLEELVVPAILGDSQVNGIFVWDNLKVPQLRRLNQVMFRIARFSM
jgi:hypothetical protein